MPYAEIKSAALHRALRAELKDCDVGQGGTFLISDADLDRAVEAVAGERLASAPTDGHPLRSAPDLT